MKFKVSYQYKAPGAPRPDDCAIGQWELEIENGQYIPIPDVGDSVSQDDWDRAYKVVSRHFGYYRGTGFAGGVNIVVTDLPDSEMAARLKE